MADVRGFNAEHLRVRIAYAHIATNQGLSLGAIHWFGVLHMNHCESIELTRMLTAEQARALNEKDRTPRSYRASQQTNRFLSRIAVQREAIRVFGQSFPLAVLLIEGNDWCMDPQHVLIGPPNIKEKLNDLVEKANKIGRWDHKKNEQAMQAIAAEWDTIIDEIKEGGKL